MRPKDGREVESIGQKIKMECSSSDTSLQTQRALLLYAWSSIKVWSIKPCHNQLFRVHVCFNLSFFTSFRLLRSSRKEIQWNSFRRRLFHRVVLQELCASPLIRLLQLRPPRRANSTERVRNAVLQIKTRAAALQTPSKTIPWNTTHTGIKAKKIELQILEARGFCYVCPSQISHTWKSGSFTSQTVIHSPPTCRPGVLHERKNGANVWWIELLYQVLTTERRSGAESRTMCCQESTVSGSNEDLRMHLRLVMSPSCHLW